VLSNTTVVWSRGYVEKNSTFACISNRKQVVQVAMPPFKGNVTIEDYHIELIISSLIVAISNHVKLVSKLSSENQAKVYSEFLMHPQSMIKRSSTGHYIRRGSVNDIAKRYSITSRPERETD
jgi:hypothetical protein